MTRRAYDAAAAVLRGEEKCREREKGSKVIDGLEKVRVETRSTVRHLLLSVTTDVGTGFT